LIPRIGPEKKNEIPRLGGTLSKYAGFAVRGRQGETPVRAFRREPNMNNWNIRWKMGLAILLAISITAVQLGLKMYSVEESILVLLFIAAAVVAVLLLLIAFVLLQEGVRRGLLWLKTRFVPIITLSDRHEAIGHPPLHR
jgi:heme/copper-type cytochrome/quinol oxidase subunit 4